MTKKTALLAMLIGVVVAMSSTSFAATSVASLNGVYSFQIQGITNEYGYYSGSTWVNLNNQQCPKSEQCFVQAFSTAVYGTLSFDGKGHATFTSIAGANNGSDGPTKGSVWAYSVSGFNGAIGSASNGAYLSLGNFNSAGIAQTVLIRPGDGNNPQLGVAILQ
jgi:hypothetical protein